MRHLPNAVQLKAAVVARADLKLSSFHEDEQTGRKRRELDERLTRVRDATRSLVRALDVDESSPLDGAWLSELQCEQGLPQDDRILFTDDEIATARSSFAAFHRLAPSSVTIEQLQRSSATISGWLHATAEIRASKAAKAALTLQTIGRCRLAMKAKKQVAALAALEYHLNTQGRTMGVC